MSSSISMFSGPEKPSLRIDVVSDVMCPWCYIGKRNLEQARRSLGDVALHVVWRPYQLDPSLPPEGKDRKTYLAEKFGGSEQADRLYRRVKEAGAAAGIHFNFDRINISPNTIDAHRVIHWAGGQGAEMQSRVVERLFDLYFLEGANIGDRAVLAEAAGDCGMESENVARMLNSSIDREAVENEAAAARESGITGVPCFIVAQRFAVMGAQPSKVLADAVRQASVTPPDRRTRPSAPDS
jgi:predicted DsbA family dithiol-disulfide isomerase